MTALDATRAAFVADILAHPDDDTPRLIFADWLEEHGEAERGEFIRVQVMLSKAEPWPPQPRTHDADDGSFGAGCECGFCSARRREHELFHQLPPADLPPIYTGKPWVEAVFGSDDPDGHPRLLYRRGFVHSVTLPPADWLAHADALTRAHPIREVRLTTWPHGAPPPGVALEERFTRAALELRWPGITFHLPEEPIPEPIPQAFWDQMTADPFA